MLSPWRFLLFLLAAGGLVDCLDVDFSDASSIKAAAATVVYDMLGTWYFGNETGNNPGNLPPPYFWWECGGMFMHMVDYFYYTGDAGNNPATVQAISWQAGTSGALMPANQTRDEGNDDQVFWAFAAMAAAELKFPPPPKGYPSWVAVGQAVFNLQAARWDAQTCGGGLRWQILPINPGYDYKNVASNGGFFQLSARLARYVGHNNTYVEWAEKMWDWISTSTLIDASDPDAYVVNDGAGVTGGCDQPNGDQYSYNYGILIGGLAYIYNHTADDKWLAPLNGIIGGLFSKFTEHNVLIEAGCEPESDCNTDGLTFKGFTVRWLALCAQLVPSTASTILPVLQASAQGAAAQCDGGDDGTFCGYHWTTSTWDGSEGVGQQMSALAAINSQLIQLDGLPGPYTLATGATSKSDPSAGTGIGDGEQRLKPVTTADRAGAGIATFVILLLLVIGTYWLIMVETE